MNLIQRQADDFMKYYLNEQRDYREFVSKVKNELWEYKNVIHKIEFLERVITTLKINFDNHANVCDSKNPEECAVNRFYENSLFFLQEEIFDQEDKLDASEFTLLEKRKINQVLEKILMDISLLKLGQQITYDDFADEFSELKNLYFLNKKNWSQLLMGKLAEMIASGIISEALSKEIVMSIKENYPNLF